MLAIRAYEEQWEAGDERFNAAGGTGQDHRGEEDSEDDESEVERSGRGFTVWATGGTRQRWCAAVEAAQTTGEIALALSVFLETATYFGAVITPESLLAEEIELEQEKEQEKRLRKADLEKNRVAAATTTSRSGRKITNSKSKSLGMDDGGSPVKAGMWGGGSKRRRRSSIGRQCLTYNHKHTSRQQHHGLRRVAKVNYSEL